MSSNDTPYNPAEETINSILTGLLPVLIFGLFNGFEDDKKKIISMINIFDDFVIFASITIYPLITAFEWYQYYTKSNKIMFLGIPPSSKVILRIMVFQTLTLNTTSNYGTVHKKIQDNSKQKNKAIKIKSETHEESVFLYDSNVFYRNGFND
uniref:Uncharacterized protein n=1 Tax=Rhizophagus irregularis (strain DAOM 181602 / DAOM 197198 / MUCL 43194) TaxID=747089 RepID=U9UI08_RHIID